MSLDGLQLLLEQANQSLGRLDAFASILPDPALFLYSYVRKEAVLSSQIEGTQSSLSDLLVYESDQTPGVPLGDVEEVSDYVKALQHGMSRLREDFPLSLRLLREIHAILLATGRGSEKHPGEFRNSQNWIGGTRPGNALFVPPPQEQVADLMSALERFLHTERTDLPVLVIAGLAHVQFETIHPFLDGNGRLGRLLITFLLSARGALKEPILYLSLYFKNHRDTYYDLLNRVRTEGAWEEWLKFFLTGVRDTAEQAVSTARDILAIFQQDGAKIKAAGPPVSVLRLFDHFCHRPITSIAGAASTLSISIPTVTSGIRQLEKLKIVRPVKSTRHPKLYAYGRFMDALNRGMDGSMGG